MNIVAATVVGLGLLLGPWLAGPASAGPALDQLRAQIDRVIKVLDDPTMKQDGQVHERRVAVRKVAEDIFDFQETAKRSLARHWQPRTPAEHAEFVKLFADLLERSYISKIETYGGERMAYLRPTVEGGPAGLRPRILPRSRRG